jgi:Mrp family chromosome partitioning ATPase
LYSPRGKPVPAAGTTYEQALLQGPTDPRLARQVARLADELTGQFPQDTGGALLLTGVAAGSHVADVAGLLARQLSGQCQREVLLVDGDGCQKVLSQRFAAGQEPGLAAAVLGTDSIRRSVVASAVPQLSFLPYGQRPLTRRATAWPPIAALLGDLRREFRYIVIAGSACPDSLTEVLGRLCDATYVVVPLGRADRSQCAQVTERLSGAGARLLGAIVTGVV